ncbi:MAG: hypothetical protein AB1349_05460 [Elusimicrobiota bacterium]
MKTAKNVRKSGNILKNKNVSQAFNLEELNFNKTYLATLSFAKSAKIVEELVCSKLARQILQANKKWAKNQL